MCLGNKSTTNFKTSEVNIIRNHETKNIQKQDRERDEYILQPNCNSASQQPCCNEQDDGNLFEVAGENSSISITQQSSSCSTASVNTLSSSANANLDFHQNHAEYGTIQHSAHLHQLNEHDKANSLEKVTGTSSTAAESEYNSSYHHQPASPFATPANRSTSSNNFSALGANNFMNRYLEQTIRHLHEFKDARNLATNFTDSSVNSSSLVSAARVMEHHQNI